MTTEPARPDPHGHVGEQIEVPQLEVDESVPPRPEEEIADVARAQPSERAEPRGDSDA